ncbi:hypothetical protein ZHAS_00019422 [Anopheles sinensis]|uniref:Uncharacterized protein n=1 Tax=Anopheles sinensis TaxID=74873 RepID=A0A084WLR9_ANOSI|nr:hypothetical protein ZHAS_00019422 [Anopheles sinensis]
MENRREMRDPELRHSLRICWQHWPAVRFVYIARSSTSGAVTHSSPRLLVPIETIRLSLKGKVICGSMEFVWDEDKVCGN